MQISYVYLTCSFNTFHDCVIVIVHFSQKKTEINGHLVRLPMRTIYCATRM